MLDRQDIDALLIGSLYGELSSTEEAKLTAHLESHPTDRAALVDLTRAREVIQESRILQVQFDPPQSISALLMQEAVRRAPKSREELGWFQRFMRSFVMHPAMAAAAMLVLVVGVAGTMYLRNGDQYAAQNKDDPSFVQQPAAQPATTRARGNAELAVGATADAGVAETSEGFKVDLRDELDGKNTGHDVVVDGTLGLDKAGERQLAKPDTSGDALKLEEEAKAKGKPSAKDPVPNPVAKVEKKLPPRLEVTTPSQTPKDFEMSPTKSVGEPSEKAEQKPDKPAAINRRDRDQPKIAGDDLSKEANIDTTTVTGRNTNLGMIDGNGVGGGAGQGSVAAGPTGNQAPSTNKTVAKPGAPPATGRAPTAPPPPTPEDKKAEPPSAELAWAKEQHAKVIGLVKAGKCNDAAALAVQIANRAPSYFASNVENDRTIKPCIQYVTAQREKEAEKVQRAKANKRTENEPPAPRAAPPAPANTSK